MMQKKVSTQRILQDWMRVDVEFLEHKAKKSKVEQKETRDNVQSDIRAGLKEKKPKSKSAKEKEKIKAPLTVIAI